jgi:hypothetical protein
VRIKDVPSWWVAFRIDPTERSASFEPTAHLATLYGTVGVAMCHWLKIVPGIVYILLEDLQCVCVYVYVRRCVRACVCVCVCVGGGG